MDETSDATPDDQQPLPTRREVREADRAALRNDLGLSGPDAADPDGDDAAVEGDHDPSAEPIDSAGVNMDAGGEDGAVEDGAVEDSAGEPSGDAGAAGDPAGAEDPEDAPTELLDPVEDSSETAVMPPVVAPGERAAAQGADAGVQDGTAAAEGEGQDATGAQDGGSEDDADGHEPTSERNWMGVTSFVTALLLLSPVAIVLGHLGLSAARKGKATNRSFALAGTVLGWVALIATAVGVWMYTQGPPAAQVDVYAQQDIHALGAEVATQAVATGQLPVLSDSGTEYTVGDVVIASELETVHAVSLTGEAPAQWCLDLTYEGGENDAYSYLPTEGVVEGACA